MKKYYINILISALYSVMIACGDHSSNGGSNDMKSSSTATTATSTTAQPEQTNQTSTTTESPTQPGSTCLLDCSIPDDLQFSFVDKRVDIKENCKVSKFMLFDLGENLLGIHLSDCGAGQQVYASRISYDLKAESSLLLTQECFDVQGDSESFEVVTGDGIILILSACKVNKSFYFKATTLELKTNALLSRNIAYHDAQSFVYLGAWNREAQAFGVAYKKLGMIYFSRFDKKLVQLGGTIELSDYTPFYNQYTRPLAFAVRDGNWFAVFNDNNYRYCSRISTNGVLGCSRIRLDASISKTTYFDALMYIATTSYKPHYLIGSLNPVNCAITFSENSPLNLSEISEDLGGFLIGNKYIGAVNRDLERSTTVNLSIFSRKPFSEISRISIMDTYSNSIGKPIIANQYIMLPYVRDGLIFVRQSDKKAPQ